MIPRGARNGRPVWIAISAIPKFDAEGAILGYRGTARDVMEWKQAQEALSDSERRFRTIFDNVPAPCS